MQNQNSIQWYISHFPESQFPCVKTHKEEYVRRLCKGKTRAEKSNILICGIARNTENNVIYDIARINKLRSYFKDSSVFIYENDSSDNTYQVFKTCSDFTILSEKRNPPPFTDPKGFDRRHYMAMARNEYLKYAKQYVKTNHVDFLIILDLDLLGGWSYHGVLNSIGQPDWDVIGSNGIYYRPTNRPEHPHTRLFYDTWAFRYLDKPEPADDKQLNLLRFNRGEPLIKVNSCFGGLAIYRPQFLHENIWYNDYDCDHPTLHNKLVERGYEIFLNPSQITLYNRTEYV